MRLAVLAALTLSAACSPQGGAPVAPPAEEAAVAQPAELGVTTSKIDCVLEKATYVEPQKGWELRFRPGEPWEMHGMTDAIFDLVAPTGEVLWGEIGSNMGTSRNVGAVFFGCARPGMDDADLSEAQVEECRVWFNVVYSLNGGEPGFLGGAAPERLLLTDLGRKVRYAGPVDGPGDEPWDVFTFKSCAS